MRDVDDSFRYGVGDGRDAVDDEEGIADDGRFDGGGSAGYDAGAGVVKGSAGVVGYCDFDFFREHGSYFGAVRFGERGREREQELVALFVLREELSGSEHFGKIEANFFGAAAGQEAYPTLGRV